MYVWGFIWSSGKVSPNKRYYNQDIIKTRNTSYGFTETRQKDHWKIISLWRGREWNTHFRWWTCANGNGWSQGTTEVLVIGLHMVGIIEYRIIFKVLEVTTTWWSECTKLLSILWTQLWNSMGHLLVKDWSQQRRKRPRPAGLLPVGLHFFWFFCCELFDASQTYVLLNFALDSTVLPSK